jgi:hypothetical protein
VDGKAGFRAFCAGLVIGLAAPAAGDPCADRAACCVHPAACVITDKQSLAEITVDAMVPGGIGSLQLGTYVSGGGDLTGVAPHPLTPCDLSSLTLDLEPAAALAAVDHLWLLSYDTPKVVDFGAPVKTVVVLVAVDHDPFPEEGLESTVWGSNTADLAAFPVGWQLATLNVIWKQGWEEPAECEPGDNADDFVGQYTFPGEGFRYVAVHAGYSITIFDDPTHLTWTTSHDDSAHAGWQSDDDETDAIGTPLCATDAVAVDAGADVTAALGETPCLEGAATSAVGIAQLAWDLDGDGDVDAGGAQQCTACDAIGERTATLFAIDSAGCAGSDTVRVTCECPAAPAAGCRSSLATGGGTLSLDGERGSLVWSWKKGAATATADFGDPTVGTEYRLCLYDATAGTPSLALDALLPPGEGWKETKTGFRYKSETGSPDGVREVGLKEGVDGKARLRVRGKLMTLPPQPLAQDTEVVAQLHHSGGTCFESQFSAPAKKNAARKFKDKSD